MRLKLDWVEDEQLLGSIDFLRHRTYVARTLIPKGYEPFFRERARYENANSSTAIEGNPLADQAAMVVLVEGSDANRPAEVEKTNLDEAYELIGQLGQDRSTRIDAGLIRTMHSIILKNLAGEGSRQRGQYRLSGIRIAEAKTKATRYVAPPPESVPDLMSQFLLDVQKHMDTGVDGAVVSALVHFGLISIHPFTDGNGRTARLMADMVLHLSDLSADGMIAASPVFFDRRREYYDLLFEVQGERFLEQLDITEFIRFHVQALGTAAAQLEEAAIRLNRRLDGLKKTTEGMLNTRQSLGLMFLFDFPQLSTMTYARLTGASRATASADLTEMVQMGLLERVGKGRNTRHELHPDFRADDAATEGSLTQQPTAPARTRAMAT